MINFIVLTTKKLLKSFVFKYRRLFLLPTKPIFINFLITYRCNSRCLMCNIWQRYKGNSKKLREELSLDEIKNFFSRDKEWLSEVKHIGITGGEAFLRNDLVEIIKFIHLNLPFTKIGIQTNGFLTELIINKLKQIREFYPDISLAVSLDGLGAIHEKIRGVKDAYNKALKTMIMAKKLGIKSITSGLTISTINYRQILKVKEKIESMGIEFSCFLQDEADYFNNQGKTIKLDKKIKLSVIKTLKNFSYHYYMDNLRLQLEGKRKRQLPCYSGLTSVVLDPYGNVKPCILRNESFGNIKKQSLGDILTSSKAKKLKSKIKSCKCWNQCEVSTSAVADPWDVLSWFIFHSNKIQFIKKIRSKMERIS